MKTATRVLFLFLAAALLLNAAETYRKPSKPIMDVLNAPATPMLSVSPSGEVAIQMQPVRYPPIAELAEPMLRLAGLRINPKTNGPHNTIFDSSFVLRKIPSGSEIPVQLPPNPKLVFSAWSPDGSHFAFTNATLHGTELWVGDSATGKAHRIEGVRINAVFGNAGFTAIARGFFGAVSGGNVQWTPDGKALLVYAVSPNRGPAPVAPAVPVGPDIQESLGGAAPVVTHEDMLQSTHDEDLFEYYATAQLTSVDLGNGRISHIGKPCIIESAQMSPDGNYVLVTSIHRPFSYLHQAREFPKEIEVWNRSGKLVHKVASVALEDHVPINGVITGPRSVEWRPSAPATLVWAEALDKGDLKNQVPFRERILALSAPFQSDPREIFKTEQRYVGIQMAARGGLALVEDFDRRKRWVRTFEIDLDKPGAEGRVIWSRNNQDRYHDPGRPMEKTMPNGQRAIIQDGDSIFLSGMGSSPEGDRPFLDRYNLASGKSERLFHCDADHYETVETLLDSHAARFLTRRESPSEPPNYFVHTSSSAMTALTKFPDPQPSIRGMHKGLVRYKRADGVQLSFTLYLPPDYKEGTKLPTVVWAYPYEYSDAATASQVSGSTKRFTEIVGYSELFFALDGYAVLANTAMPVVGSDPDTVNNSYIDQIVADSKAAIDKATEMGVTDPTRVGVGGHSYGAFMTTNLLAHCDLFKAGIAESGAHNRTLTPFGFQSERRTIWEAPDVYLKMSPFLYANKIKVPVLLIHGAADDNDGTFPIQSERMYEAIRGNGGTVRLVFLPFEAHGYRGKETIEHVVWEKLTWFDKYVKGAGAQSTNN